MAATSARACAADSTIGISSTSTPRSSSCLISTGSPTGGLTTGVTGYGATACSCARIERRSFGACSLSMSSQSTPDPAQISATTGLPDTTHMPVTGRSPASAARQRAAV